MSKTVSEAHGELAGASNVLVLEAGGTEAPERVHRALYDGEHEPRDALAVTFSQPET